MIDDINYQSLLGDDYAEWFRGLTGRFPLWAPTSIDPKTGRRRWAHY